MDATMMVSLCKMGGAAAFGLSATGSALGSGVAAMAAIGAWKRCYAQGKMAPFMLVAFMAAPLSQTFYGMIVMNGIVAAATAGAHHPALIAAGLFGGLAIGVSAWYQGKAGAAASDAFGETGQGFGNYMIALGVIETVAILVLVFIGKVVQVAGAAG